MTMTPERLAEIREMVAALDEPYDQRIGSLASVRLSLYAISNTRDLLACVAELTRQLEDARRLALPAFTSPEGDMSEHTHVMDGCGSCWTCLPQERGLRMFLCSMCGNKRCPHATDCSLDCTQSNESGQVGSRYGVPVHMPGSTPIPGIRLDFQSTPDRPSAYDMPVGSVVVTEVGSHTRTGSDDWRLAGDKDHRLRSDFIEGLFADGLVTEWRLP